MTDGYEAAELERAECYPDAPTDVHVVQTHASVVCLAGDRVYKLKKPLALPFLDYSTVALRAHWCAEEVRLNRRLCPDVYLDVVPLCRDADGPNFRGRGDVVDHAVRMTRLPAERMLDVLLERDEVSTDDVRRLAVRVAAFHAQADRGPDVREAGAPAKLEAAAHANYDEMATQIGAVFDADLHAALAAQTRRDFAAALPILDRRCRDGRVVDGHGDLHARNVCLTEPPQIYDCIEFSAEFRCGDVATEVAFLAMDLRYRGHDALARTFVDAYVEASHDDELKVVLPSLIRYRAAVRAKVAGLAAADPDIPDEGRTGARGSAARHLRLAAASAIDESGPWCVAACGLPASGKSHVFERLARAARGPWEVVSSDRVRKERVGVASTERADASAYAPAVSDTVYDELARSASGYTAPVVLLDANYPTAERRAALRSTAANRRVVFVWFDVDEVEAKRRLAARADDSNAVSDADASVYDALRARFEAPVDEPDVLRVDGALDADILVDRILTELVARGAE